MKYIEMYKILSFEKKKIDYKKVIISTKSNLIIVIINAKQHGAQIFLTILKS
jgi:phosphorylcholine metabolism protein LicD